MQSEGCREREGANPQDGNPLGYERITRLLPRFAIPSVIGMLTGALYNIVDQIFIGKRVGILGVAATNVDLPLAMIALAAALLFGIGGAANFSLSLGAGRADKAARIVGNSILWMTVFGVAMTIVVRLFLYEILPSFGATAEVMPYSLEYTGIVSWGLPAAVLSIGMSHLIRADGSPGYAMACTVTGCLVNVSLDALLMFGVGMGVAGAAYATVAAQYVSLAMGVLYLTRFRHARLLPGVFRPDMRVTLAIISIGAASCINQISMSIVQVALNNTLTAYGAKSIYGAEVPLAAVGVIMKVTMIFMSVVIGVAQGCQPIIGYNYGARNYARVRATFKLAITIAFGISFAAFLCYRLFPVQIIGIFNAEDPMFVSFAVRCFHVYLLLGFLTGVQPVVANFFTSIGRAIMGVFISLTRQFMFFLPLIMLLPLRWGIDGVLYAGPVADAASFILAALLVSRELHRMKTSGDG